MATNIITIIKPVIYGAVVIFLLFWFGFIIRWVLLKTGIWKAIKQIFNWVLRRKPSEEVYEEVTKMVAEGKSLKDIAEVFSKYPLKKQKQYIQVYYEILKMQEKELKGGLK
jgi:hypothetical protein